MKSKFELTTFALSLALLVSLVFAPAAYAFDGRDGQTITIGEDEVVTEDLYLTGEIVTVDGTIQGDLMVAASEIIINGVVEGDLWAAGRTLTLNGSVGDDVFFGGAAATFGPDSQVSDDVFLGGYSLEARPGSQIGGTVLLGAYQALLSGDLGEDLLAGANRIRIEGTVGGDVTVDVASPDDGPEFSPTDFNPEMPAVPMLPAGLTLGDEAQVEGNVQYTSRQKFELSSERIGGSIEHLLPRIQEEVTQQVEDTPGKLFAAWLFDNIRNLVALLVVGVLLAWLLPAWVVNPSQRLQTKPWPSLGWGLVVFIVVPFAVLIAVGVVIAVAVLMGALTLGNLLGAVLSIGGAVLSATITVYSLVLSYLTKSVVAYLGGHYLVNRFRPEWNAKVYAPLLIGLVILAAVFAIPILGGLVEFFVMLFGLGAIFLIVRERFTSAPAAPAAMPVPTPVTGD
jgi:hypothetical protein